jgi:hypothetical protein
MTWRAANGAENRPMQRRVIAFCGLLAIWIALIAVGCGGMDSGRQ